MRYLSIYGAEGFRTFMGVLNGKLAYTPDKIPAIDPEIVMERDYALRLQEVVGPYADQHPKLKDVLPVISNNIGTLHSISDKCSVWRPRNHLSLLSELLLAGLFETFLPEEMSKNLYFLASGEDTGIAFQQAFSLENKNILIPLDNTYGTPLETSNTNVFSIDMADGVLKENLFKQQTLYCDHKNIFRIVGHMATMIEALYATEEKRQRFYNDIVSLVIPADNMEFVLAAYYLLKSKFPIKNIYAISTEHRMVHNFIDKGEFKINDIATYEKLEISLDRMLFEAARGSAEKVVFWKKELVQNGSFKVDFKTLQSIQSKFKSQFATKAHCDSIREEFKQQTDIQETKFSLMGYKLSQGLSEHVLVFDAVDPSLPTQNPTLKPLTKSDIV